MEIATYEVEAAVEATHWWFVARRRLLASVIRTLVVPTESPVLDIGTSTGSNLRLLQDLGYRNVVGVDTSDTAIRYCTDKGFGSVRHGDMRQLPFERGRFQLILATDVLEHIDDDLGALAELTRVLAPGGTAIVTVPAFPCLWGLQDDVAHHKRRYRMKPFAARLRAAGLSCREQFHFNYLLFGPIWLARRLIRLFRISVMSENQINARWLNRFLTTIFTFDVWSARWLRPPFGVSILAVAHKESST
ncbi:MAG: class I SAM-dependent methyltransferase [Candidatus Omnitrophica bacterium]|nr:class I SAM-dependent methyltransferase [Candidatus Omnitrophota bacterium]